MLRRLLPGLLCSTLLLVCRVGVGVVLLVLLLWLVVVACRRALLRLVRGRAGALLLLLWVLLVVVLGVVVLRVWLGVLLRVAMLLQLAARASWAVLLLLLRWWAPVAIGLLVAGRSLVVVRGSAMAIALMVLVVVRGAPGPSSTAVARLVAVALSCRVPAIRVVASPVSPSIAALVATSMPAITRLTSIKDIWVVDVRHSRRLHDHSLKPLLGW